MEIKVEDLKHGKFKLTLTVSPKEMAGYFNKAYEKIVPTIKLDGFRPGKAPRKVIEGAAGVARILSEGLDLAVSESYFKAIAEKKMIPLDQPKIVINKYPNYGSTEKEVKDSFEFEAEIECLPAVSLGDYSKEKLAVGKKESAKKEDVTKVLTHFQKQNSTFNEMNRPAQKGDFIEVSYEGFVKHVRIDQMCSKNHPLVLGENTLIPGFEDQLVGLSKGDKKEFTIKFPKDYHAKEHAGKDAVFKIELINVKEIVLPELNDDFALKFGHKNMKELTAAIEENLNKELEENFKREMEAKAIDKVLPYLKVEIPETLIKREVGRMLAEFDSQITGQGINFDKYLEGIKKTREEIEKEMRPQAEKNVRIGLLLGKLVEENKWDQHDPEIGRKAIDYLVKNLSK